MNKLNTISLPNKKGKHHYHVTVVDGCLEKFAERRRPHRNRVSRQKDTTRAVIFMALYERTK